MSAKLSFFETLTTLFTVEELTSMWASPRSLEDMQSGANLGEPPANFGARLKELAASTLRLKEGGDPAEAANVFKAKNTAYLTQRLSEASLTPAAKEALLDGKAAEVTEVLVDDLCDTFATLLGAMLAYEGTDIGFVEHLSLTAFMTYGQDLNAINGLFKDGDKGLHTYVTEMVGAVCLDNTKGEEATKTAKDVLIPMIITAIWAKYQLFEKTAGAAMASDEEVVGLEPLLERLASLGI